MNNTKIFGTALLLSLALFQSCSKDKNNNTDQLATLSKATITGNVYARLADTSGASVIQYAPTTATINAWIDTKDFVVNPDNGSNYAKKYYTANVASDGSYKLTVDVSKYQAANVHVEPASFIYNRIKNTIGVVAHDSIYTLRTIYYTTPSAQVISVSTNATAIQDISYSY